MKRQLRKVECQGGNDIDPMLRGLAQDGLPRGKNIDSEWGNYGAQDVFKIPNRFRVLCEFDGLCDFTGRTVDRSKRNIVWLDDFWDTDRRFEILSGTCSPSGFGPRRK